MARAENIHGSVFKNGTATLLARVVGANGSNVVQSDFYLALSSSGDCGVSATYSIYLLDAQNPDSRTIIAAHFNVSLDITDIIFDALQTGSIWTVDDTGYNFKHTIEICDDPAFTIAGRQYLVEYTLVPITGQPVILRFLLSCI